MQKFSDYFNDWLYGQKGYYSNYKTIGKEGDFYTSVSTSSFFGGAIAKKIITEIENKKLSSHATILEVGSHHGYLLADIIQFIYTLKPKLLNTLRFAIVERFDKLQLQQKNYLEQSFGNAITLDFYNDISEVRLSNAFVIANEIFDAFSCELVYTKDNQLHQGFIHNHTITFEPCKDMQLLEYCKKNRIEKGEVAVGYEAFLNTLSTHIEHFIFVTFDYGDNYPRNDFSTRIYSKHKVIPLFEEGLNLKEYFAVSDITYDVNFQHLIHIAKDLNLTSNYQTQMQALIEFGIIELLEILKANVDENSYLRETQKVKTLLEPTGMGDRFKMLELRN